MIVSTLGILTLAALLGWILGGIALRLGGLLIGVAGLAGLVISGDVAGVLAFVIGAVLWLAGHWHYAVRHQEYKSPLSRHLFARWLPAPLDPTRQWTSAVFDERPRRERSGRRGEVR
jgi:hypothetical protein